MENKKWQRRREKNIKLSFFGSFLKKLYGLINVYVILYIVCLEFIALLRLWCTCDVASALVLLSRIQYILHLLFFLSTWRVLYVMKIVVPVQLLLLSPWSIPMITWRRDVPRARDKSRGLQDSAKGRTKEFTWCWDTRSDEGVTNHNLPTRFKQCLRTWKYRTKNVNVLLLWELSIL